MAPRITLVVVAAFALFFVLALLYSAPVFMEPPPAGAGPDYVAERVREHLNGKVPWLLGGSFLVVGALASRWLTR